MHNMFDENAKRGEIPYRFPSLIGSRSQLELNGGHHQIESTRKYFYKIIITLNVNHNPTCYMYLDALLIFKVNKL